MTWGWGAMHLVFFWLLYGFLPSCVGAFVEAEAATSHYYKGASSSCSTS